MKNLYHSEWPLLIAWILVVPVLGTLCLLVPVTIISGLSSSFFVGDNALAPLLIFAFALVVITAPLVGITQALILTRMLNNVRWSMIGQWVLATIAGVLLAIFASGAINAALLCGGGIILPGLVLGFAQWLVLRRYVQQAGWWLLACTLAWNAGLLVSLAVSVAYPVSKDIALLPYYPLRNLPYLGRSWFAGMLVIQLVTGFALLWLLGRAVEATHYEQEPAPR